MLVNLRLIRAGYFARRPLKKLLLLQRHRHARMDWARNHLRWRPGHWQHVIFSDECRFLLYRIDGRIRDRRQQHEPYNKDYIVPRVQAGGDEVTIWGAFHHGGKCELHLIDGNLDEYPYLQILEEKLLPFARLTFGLCTRMTTPGLTELAQWSISWNLKGSNILNGQQCLRITIGSHWCMASSAPPNPSTPDWQHASTSTIYVLCHWSSYQILNCY